MSQKRIERGWSVVASRKDEKLEGLKLLMVRDLDVELSPERGYVVADVTADRLVAEFRFVADTASPDAPLAPGSRWEITAGDPEPRPA